MVAKVQKLSQGNRMAGHYLYRCSSAFPTQSKTGFQVVVSQVLQEERNPRQRRGQCPLLPVTGKATCFQLGREQGTGQAHGARPGSGDSEV